MATDEDINNLAWTLLGEARGEGRRGMQAVGNVILNRLANGRWGNTISQVVRFPSAFTMWNAGKPDPATSWPVGSAPFNAARGVAEQLVSGQLPDITGGAVQYWAPRVMQAQTGQPDPYWAREAETHGRLQIGNQIFLPTHPIPVVSVAAAPNSSGGPDDRALPPIPRQDPRNAPIPRPRLQRQGTDAIVDSVYGRAHGLDQGFAAVPPGDDIYGGFYPPSTPIPPVSGGPQSMGPRTALDAASALAQAVTAPAPSAALGYAGDARGGLGYGSPVVDSYRGAPASGVNQPSYGDPRLQQGNVYAQGPMNAAPLSPFESAMAGVRSSVIPKYIAVTHHVPNPDYVAQFGPIEPPMPDFVGMLAARWSRDRNANAGPALAQVPGDFGASPVGRFGDYLLNQSPPPLPPAPPLPIIQDPDAIRALLAPALQALQNQRAAAAMQAGQPAYGADNGGLVPTTTTDGQGRSSLWDDANGIGASLASRG
jgi:hypothetical protein